MEGLHYLLIGSRSLTDMERIIRQFADHPYPLPSRQEAQPRSWKAEEQDYFLSLGGYFPEEEGTPVTERVDQGIIPEQDLYDKEFPFGSE